MLLREAWQSVGLPAGNPPDCRIRFVAGMWNTILGPPLAITATRRTAGTSERGLPDAGELDVGARQTAALYSRRHLAVQPMTGEQP